MKKLSLYLTLLFLLSITACTQQNASSSGSDSRIRHTVAFKLKYPVGSTEEREFLDASEILATIPVVQNFETFRETSKKNDYDYFFYMEFQSEEDYETYNLHPDHVAYVEKYWVNYVDKFIEIDYEPLK